MKTRAIVPVILSIGLLVPAQQARGQDLIEYSMLATFISMVSVPGQPECPDVTITSADGFAFLSAVSDVNLAAAVEPPADSLSLDFVPDHTVTITAPCQDPEFCEPVDVPFAVMTEAVIDGETIYFGTIVFGTIVGQRTPYPSILFTAIDGFYQQVPGSIVTLVGIRQSDQGGYSMAPYELTLGGDDQNPITLQRNGVVDIVIPQFSLALLANNSGCVYHPADSVPTTLEGNVVSNPVLEVDIEAASFYPRDSDGNLCPDTATGHDFDGVLSFHATGVVSQPDHQLILTIPTTAVFEVGEVCDQNDICTIKYASVIGDDCGSVEELSHGDRHAPPGRRESGKPVTRPRPPL